MASHGTRDHKHDLLSNTIIDRNLLILMGYIHPVSDVSSNTKHYNREGSNHIKSTEDSNNDTTSLLGLFEIRQDDGANQYELDQMKECEKYTSIKTFCIGIRCVVDATLCDCLQKKCSEQGHQYNRGESTYHTRLATIVVM